MSDRTRSQASQTNAAADGIKMLVATFERRAHEFEARLPTTITLESFKDAFVQAITTSRGRLLQADPASLFLALQKCADAGLKPDGQEAAITIFGDDKEGDDGNVVASTAKGYKQAVFIPMVWGLVKLIKNAGGVKSVVNELVFQGEHCRIILGDEPRFEHERSLEPDFDYSYHRIIGAYAIVSYLDGSIEREWMNRTQLARVAAVNPSKKGPRKLWGDEMDRKAPLRRLSKKLAKSKELVRLMSALDNDDAREDVDEIDGFATENREPRQLDRPTSQTDIELNREPRQTADLKPGEEEDQRDASLGTKVRNASGPVDGNPGGAGTGAGNKAGADNGQSGSTVRGAGTSAAANSPPPFEAWPVDEFGEPAAEAAIMSPADFAAWFEAKGSVTKNIEALRENNMDSIGDVDSAAALRITLAIGNAVERLRLAAEADAPAPTTETGEQSQQAASDGSATLTEIPKQGNGKPHWGNYIGDARKALAGLATTASVDEWQRINLPTYQGKAIEAAIDKELEYRRAAITKAGADPKRDPDEAWADREIADFAKMTSPGQVNAWAESGAISTVMTRLKTQKPEIFERVKAACNGRHAELSK